MQLGQIDVELADGVHDQGGQQAGAIRLLQMVQGATDAIIVEHRHLVG